MKLFSFRSLFALSISTLLCLSLSACKEPAAENTTAPQPAPAATAENTTLPQSTTSESSDETALFGFGEIMDKISSWAGFSDEGVLKEKGSSRNVVIREKSDLDPYLPYLSDFTEADADAIFADGEGYCILVEITKSAPNSYYSTSSVFSDLGLIDIYISEFADEESAEQPEYTVFLFHIPSQYYNGEQVRVQFLNS